MHNFIKRIKIKQIEFENNLALAPLAGISIKPYRKFIRNFGARILFTEMISSHGLYYNNKKTWDLVDISGENPPVIVQIFGNDPEILAISSEMLVEKGVKFIDINMGCPAQKVVNHGSGSSLMKDPDKIVKIIKSVRKRIDIPLSIKIRAGFDLNNINAPLVAKIAEDEGIDLITIHARTRSQKFNDFNWDVIREVKNVVKIPVIGNGNIFTPYDIKNMYETSLCDGFMIGRASFHNPWIFRQILEFYDKGSFNEILEEDRLNYILYFSLEFLKYRGERGIFELRKFIVWLVKGMKRASEIRSKLFEIKSLDDLYEIIKEIKNNKT